MNEMMGEWYPYFVILAGGVVTYATRGFGVLLAGRLSPDSEIFHWVGCVALALMTALIARMIIVPMGILQDAPAAARISAGLLALIAFYAARRSVLVGCAVGVAALIALTLLLRTL